jgi:hypothetical protein
MKHVHYLLIVFMIGCTLALSDANAASRSVGSIARTIGDTLIERDKESIATRNATMIYSGDRIVTGDHSWLTINFFDLTRIVLRPNSEFVIHEFPTTMDSGSVSLELIKGGVRITAGTISNASPDNFKLMTPHGLTTGSRAEWVVRVCEKEDCSELEATFQQCSSFLKPPTADNQFVSVYKGSVNVAYCPLIKKVGIGSTAVFNQETLSCKKLDEVPCFILSDGKLGKDKLRKFLPKLTPDPNYQEKDSTRPQSRPKRPESRPPMPRPRVNRPRPRQR